ncbi:hypothetical protein BDW42DRAFT_157601 [Aspergillus taichungensis]|uniref:Uncharacterized protein n=1 Tax=Aspergillus taichungensis TaxID=482145 RepID=A0A2J5HKH9_9EURO|nr:hypothetical protein BDW42DRAFT_157601 [Aspergillus taichungensis]
MFQFAMIYFFHLSSLFLAPVCFHSYRFLSPYIATMSHLGRDRRFSFILCLSFFSMFLSFFLSVYLVCPNYYTSINWRFFLFAPFFLLEFNGSMSPLMSFVVYISLPQSGYLI